MTETPSVLMTCPKCGGGVVLCSHNYLEMPYEVRCAGHAEGKGADPCGWWAPFVDERMGVGA